MDLKDKTAVVTGAGRGLGKAIALKLAQMGASLVLFDIVSSDSLDETTGEFNALGYKAVSVKGDVRDEADVSRLMNTAVDTFGGLDVLVNNAGITKDTLLIRMTEKDWEDVLSINLKGAFLCTREAAKIMIKRRKGTIINIASVAGVMGNAGQANYSSSKAGLIGLTKTTAKELASRQITCNAVAPGLIKSKMTDVLPDNVKERYLTNIPLGRFGTPEDVADVVGFLSTDWARYINGQVINIDGGLVM